MATQLVQKNVVDVDRLVSFTCSDRPASKPQSKPAQFISQHRSALIKLTASQRRCMINTVCCIYSKLPPDGE